MRVQATAAVLGLASAVQAQIATTCSGNVCFGLNIPSAVASSGKGDVYFQMSAPVSYQWVALGQGSSMDGSNIFVMYTDSTGNNVTVSPRLGKGEVEPEHNSDASITLLEGTGVNHGVMTANVRCSSCDSWSGGSMDFTKSSTRWIHAYKKGSQLNSDDPNAEIEQHDDGSNTAFSFQSNKATGGNSLNPFQNPSTTSGPNGSQPSQSGTSGPITSGNGGSSDDDESEADIEAAAKKARNILIAHGVMAGLAMVILFPVGAIMIRVLDMTGLPWIHGGVQILSYLVFTCAVGLGIWTAKKEGELSEHHPIIGLLVFSLLFLQPWLGLAHHSKFKEHKKRTAFSHAHIWLGRIAITLGIINGGLGLQLADNTNTGYIIYGVVAAFFWLCWMAAIFVGERRRKARDQYSQQEK